MDNNNGNPSTGNKGVFPGSASSVQHNEHQNTAPQAPPQAPQQIDNQQDVPKNTAPKQPQNQLGSKSFVEPAADGDVNTYIRLETQNSEGQVSGVLEIDLISFRERGIESRYLSINTVGMGMDNHESNTTISIDNEADFLRFKEFVSKLNWND